MSDSYAFFEAVIKVVANNVVDEKDSAETLKNLVSVNKMANSFMRTELARFKPDEVNQALFYESMLHGVQTEQYCDDVKASIWLAVYHYGEQQYSEEIVMVDEFDEWTTSLTVRTHDTVYTFFVDNYESGNLGEFVNSIRNIDFDSVYIDRSNGEHSHRFGNHRHQIVMGYPMNISIDMSSDEADEFDAECDAVINSLMICVY